MMLSPHPCIKVYGCGSAGMHIAHAARVMGWPVDMVDIDERAVERVPSVYASRYGTWDEAINTYYSDNAPTGDYDICVISTPPLTHIPLALEAWEKHDPHAVLIEKPLCAPHQCEEARALLGTRTFVGYTHLMTCAQFNMRQVSYLSVEFRESWSYVMKAHPWNSQPEDSYLGDWRAGGGATSEHSHAINLWEYLVRPDHGEVVQVQAQMTKIGNKYDSTAWLHLTTEDGFSGHVTMDTLASPSIKMARVNQYDGGEQFQAFGKCDFIAELQHVYQAANTPLTSLLWTESPITFEKGWRTARIIAAAHRAAVEGRPVCLASQ